MGGETVRTGGTGKEVGDLEEEFNCQKKLQAYKVILTCSRVRSNIQEFRHKIDARSSENAGKNKNDTEMADFQSSMCNM